MLNPATIREAELCGLPDGDEPEREELYVCERCGYECEEIFEDRGDKLCHGCLQEAQEELNHDADA